MRQIKALRGPFVFQDNSRIKGNVGEKRFFTLAVRTKVCMAPLFGKGGAFFYHVMIAI